MRGILDAQQAAQGVAVCRVKDGTLFVFTRETLARLFAASEKNGEAILFVKEGPKA